MEKGVSKYPDDDAEREEAAEEFAQDAVQRSFETVLFPALGADGQGPATAPNVEGAPTA